MYEKLKIKMLTKHFTSDCDSIEQIKKHGNIFFVTQKEFIPRMFVWYTIQCPDMIFCLDQGLVKGAILYFRNPYFYF